jgi:HK97 gp10 family phage protein
VKDLIHVQGLQELDRKLGQLPLRIRKNVLRRALRAGGKVIGQTARKMAPRIWAENAPTRLLKARNIVWRVSRIRGDTAQVKVTWRTGRPRDKSVDVPFYAAWVEFGTSRLPARPFLRPAFMASKMQALDAFRKALADGIDKEVAKLR